MRNLWQWPIEWTRSLCWLSLIVALVTTGIAADEVASSSKLNLPNGDFSVGQLQDSSRANVVLWRDQHFTGPFEFAAGHVSSIHFPLPKPLPQTQGDYCFELAGEDVVFGNLMSIDADSISVQTQRFGAIKLARQHVRRFYRWQGTELIHLGPTGLVGWSTLNADKPWSEEGGQPFTKVEGATLRGDFQLPAQSVIEFEVSWREKPDFVIALGVNGVDAVIRQAFRFEVWLDDLIVQRELATVADVAALQSISAGPGRAHLIAYLDQTKGQLQVFAPSGQQLANLKVASKKPEVFGSIQIENKRGDLRLERLRISRWNGVAPQGVQVNRTRLHRVDGSINYGQLVRYDAAKREFVLKEDAAEKAIPAQELASVVVTAPEPVAPRAMRVITHEGTQLSGDVQKIENGSVTVLTPGITAAMKIPVADLRSILSLRIEKTPDAPPSGRQGTLGLEGTLLRGHLVNGTESAQASTLVWQPLLAKNSSPLQTGTSGKIVYRIPPPKPTTPPQTMAQAARAQQVRPNAGIGGALLGLLAAGKAPPAKPQSTHTLHLRSGDTIPCEVQKIDEKGLTIKSTVATATSIPNDKVKALELVREEPPKLPKAKRERLLTLPRLQKESPPTHLIRSTNGDFLRGRLVELKSDSLKFEVRLETKQIPTSSLAQIIWLHADELPTPTSTSDKPAVGEQKPASEPPLPAKITAAPSKTRVQTLRGDGIRLTFFPERMEGDVISGQSDVIGACRADVREVDQLIFGAAIEEAASALVFHQWKLHHALEPRFVTAPDSGEGRNPGLDSALVGQPAPIFELDQLNGQRFKLADTKGRVVVLDFWASWCGPCLQAMPEISSVVAEFADSPVTLVAINIEEPASTIKATLERHKLKPTVALDVDGVVALKYGATAIPQTVIIDHTGTVARVFIGGGPKLKAELREAIQAVLKKPE